MRLVAHVLPFDGQSTYELEIAGARRQLPLIQVAPDTWIAYYYSLGDTEVIDRAARILSERMAGCELFVTTETKGIPLAHAIATYLGLRPYVVCRKEIRPFMLSPLSVRYKPITAKTEQELFLDGRDALKLRGRAVGLVDDIVSTGETLQAMAELVERAGGRVVAKAALLLEGQEWPDVHHMGILPVFKSSG
ncbi:MAG: phosphoribosyltransferase family protein [Armatimonadota bacterium]|nr:phosphoribosyltransferase family protein [Armatimonadota bacterium]MDR5676259.1 phosphoribosyltransferase family protein [Armatimonadota bacterium]MDR5690237.1 phosphoribosyltransferase family protein [Armatimonadota bacterium]MDR7388514.1 phosphoribosyltransferase family protein [Armatimonadota bacterium]MDR7391327.1 phosphoribosyltransferase family protein [Armatimonadota bacterium]